MAALAVAVAFGLFMDTCVYRPIQRHEGSFFTVFVAAFGVVVAVQSLLELTFGRSFVSYTSALTRARPILAGLYLAPMFWVALGVTAAVLALIGIFLGRSRAGIGLARPVGKPGTAGRLRPVRPVALGAGLRGRFRLGRARRCADGRHHRAAAVNRPHVMLISLAAAIVGGIGSLRGAVAAGVLLGV